ncbi:MAG: DUF1573 domain-containing protein [Bacteroidota bacterium]|nr:DUF1573 domain-containing protein [Bacteroidota bacterium]
MKTKLLLLAIILLIGISSQSQISVGFTVNPNVPKIKFETETIDYGTIEKGSNGIREFKFTNVGKDPLLLSNVQSSCGCVAVDWPKEPFKSGASGIIKVKYDTNRIGPFTKTVTVTSNAEEPSKILKIKGVVVEVIKADSTSIKIPRSDN